MTQVVQIPPRPMRKPLQAARCVENARRVLSQMVDHVGPGEVPEAVFALRELETALRFLSPGDDE